MADESPSARQAIVTLRSLPSLPDIEATTDAADATADIDPIERAMLLNRYRALRDQL